MTLYLCREEFREDGIFSDLRDASGKVLFVTAEHAYNSLPKLPNGTYVCQRGQHQLHSMPRPFSAFEIMNVPGHTGVLFHPGNFPQIDSDGCVLIGQTIEDSPKGRMVTSSQVSFAAFMGMLNGIDSFELVVS